MCIVAGTSQAKAMLNSKETKALLALPERKTTQKYIHDVCIVAGTSQAEAMLNSKETNSFN